MDILTRKKVGRPTKFTLLGIENGPIKARGYAKKFPYQYANYWNNNNDTKVHVVFNKKDEPFFQCDYEKL